MHRFRILAVAGCILALGLTFVHAQDVDLKAVLRKSIEAHGGAKNLAKFKAATSKFKGNMEIMGMKLDLTGESNFQKPDKFKNVMAMEINGKTIDVVTVYNGKKMWIAIAGMTKEIDDEKTINSVREELQVEGAGSLVDFLKAPYELNSVGDVKVKGKDAIGIRVSKKGQKDFTLYFDKKSNLLVKTEMRTLDPMSGQEVTQEKFISGYQDKQGMKVARRLEIHKDGKLFMDLEITEVQALDRLDDAMFAKP